MNRFYNIAGTVSGIIGACVLLALFLSQQMGLMMSIVLGACAFSGTYILISAFKPKNVLTFEAPEDVTPQLLESTLKDGEAKIKLLVQYASGIADLSVRKKVMDISAVIRNIYDNFKKDPKEIKYAKQFLSYYFDTTIKIVKKYVELSSQNLHDPAIQKTLLKAENMLGSIETAFEKQQAKLLSNDVMDLDVEIETLEKTFNAEDLK